MREAMKAKGYDDDEMLSEGQHILRRRPKNKILKNRSEAKIKIGIFLDADILDYIKARAVENAASFEAQINKELRAVMERDKNDSPYSALLKDEQFIGTLCEILEPRLSKRRRAA
jgi:guanylate kinase